MKRKHKTQNTSLIAYAEILGNLGEKQSKVFAKLRKLKSANNKMLSRALNWRINCVTGRVKELREFGIVRAHKKDFCPITLKEEGKLRLTIFWKPRRWDF